VTGEHVINREGMDTTTDGAAEAPIKEMQRSREYSQQPEDFQSMESSRGAPMMLDVPPFAQFFGNPMQATTSYGHPSADPQTSSSNHAMYAHGMAPVPRDWQHHQQGNASHARPTWLFNQVSPVIPPLFTEGTSPLLFPMSPNMGRLDAQGNAHLYTPAEFASFQQARMQHYQQQPCARLFDASSSPSTDEAAPRPISIDGESANPTHAQQGAYIKEYQVSQQAYQSHEKQFTRANAQQFQMPEPPVQYPHRHPTPSTSSPLFQSHSYQSHGGLQQAHAYFSSLSMAKSSPKCSSSSNTPRQLQASPSEDVQFRQFYNTPYSGHVNDQSTIANYQSQRQQQRFTSPPNTPSPPKQPRFICQIDDCGKTFTTRQSLKSHASTHLDDSAKTFVCHLCGNVFYSEIEATAL
jgi:hypothetical protein